MACYATFFCWTLSLALLTLGASASECSFETPSAKDLIDELYKSSKDYDVSGPNLRRILSLRDQIIDTQGPFDVLDGCRRSYVDQFTRWAKKNLQIYGIDIKWSDEFGGLSLVAAKDLFKHEELLRVPSEMTISTENIAERYRCLDDVTRDHDIHHLTWLAKDLFVEVLVQASRNDSIFESYLRTMPRDYDVPMFFSYEDFVALNGSVAFKKAVYTTVTSLNIFSKLHDRLYSSSACAKTIGLPLEKFTLANFLWAYAVVVSRQYNGWFREGDTNKVLMPVYDLLNHANVGTVRTESQLKDYKDGQATGDHASLTTQFVSQGEELMSSYHDNMDTRNSFTTYGFVTDNFYPLTIELEHEDAAMHYVKRDIGLSEVYLWNPRLTGQVLSYTRFQDLLKVANGSEQPGFSVDSVRTMWNFLIEQIARRLRKYRIGVDEIEKTLNSTTRGHNLVLRQLQSEQALLLKIKDHIKEAMLG